MNDTSFKSWLEAMKNAGIAKDQRACAKLLGVSEITIGSFKRRGCDKRTALACSALLSGLKPYKQ